MVGPMRCRISGSEPCSPRSAPSVFTSDGGNVKSSGAPQSSRMRAWSISTRYASAFEHSVLVEAPPGPSTSGPDSGVNCSIDAVGAEDDDSRRLHRPSADLLRRAPKAPLQVYAVVALGPVLVA